ncbi:hypothetical protein pdam_00020747, partial [Pocillopora damicornis]
THDVTCDATHDVTCDPPHVPILDPIHDLMQSDLLNKKATTVNSGIPAPSGGHQVSEPGVYMELHPRTPEGKSREPSEYQSLQDTQVTSSYYNVGFKKERSGKKDGGIYENSHS